MCNSLNGAADVSAMRDILLVLERPDVIASAARARMRGG